MNKAKQKEANSGSPFLDPVRWINENDYAVALRDTYPVSPGHTLIVPKRLVGSVFELTPIEVQGCWDLLSAEKKRLVDEFKPDGFNIGVNIGEAAGQTIWQAHFHLIPRYRGDHSAPRGGVRAVIPGKANY
jgi:diadenosine tetraphosphate (Ap4A) HIT family hydrolase